MHDSVLLQKLFQARPRYQKQRSHENNPKTNPPNWRGTSHFGRTAHTHARCPRKGERATYCCKKAHFAITRSCLTIDFMHYSSDWAGQTSRESSTENIGTSYGLRFIHKDVLCL